jgi:ComF family protein
MDSPVNPNPFAKVYRTGLLPWLERLADALIPPRCLLCEARGQAGVDLCPACTRALPWLGPACPRCALPLAHAGVCGSCLRQPPPLDAVHACLRYAAPVDHLLPRFKFHNDLAAGRLLATLMARRAPALDGDVVLVPVPLHPRRLRQRGYDQALELARPLAHQLDLALAPSLLRRVAHTQAQSGLDARARRRNLRAAFGVTTAQPPPRVVLVDDVMTTGATLQAATRALRRAGVIQVQAWVCARTP